MPAKKLTSDQKTMRKIARKIRTIMEKDLPLLEDSKTQGWFKYILKDVYQFVSSASDGPTDEYSNNPPDMGFMSKEEPNT